MGLSIAPEDICAAGRNADLEDPREDEVLGLRGITLPSVLHDSSSSSLF